MNIFALSRCPRRAAQYACDRHVVKMLLESIELLASAHRVLDGRNCYAENRNGRQYLTVVCRDWREHFLPYRNPLPGMLNNHHTVCARATAGNYAWLAEHAVALAEEYHYRWGARRGSHHIWYDCAVLLREMPPTNLPPGELQPFRQGVVEDCKRPPHRGVWAHRLNYVRYKSRFAQWTRREPPRWYLEMQAKHPPRHNGQRRSISPRSKVRTPGSK